MICPYCKINIDDDSWFCDQCGQEILICPRCNKVGKGKRCVHDGTALVAARVKAGMPAALTDGKAISDGAGAAPAIKAQPISGRATELHLINKNLDLDLKIENDEVIGRTVGAFTEVFSRFPQVSRRHCQIKFDEKQGWSVIDLGSTNGTKFNNIPLRSGQAQVLTDKSLLLIANIEFYIEIRSKGDKDGTVRI